MPRTPRKYSETGIYHIMLRGNARENIFIDNQDKGKLLKIILQKRKEGLFLIYAYCIMDNHAHLILKELKEPISNSMKKITTSYAYYFNKKYNRVGHVFQDRFRSEVIKDDSYLLSVIRYVHNNPEHAVIKDKEDYQWSSYQFYISQDSKLPETKDILKIFSTDLNEAVGMFADFSKKFEKREYLDIEKRKVINQQDINHFMEEFLKSNNMKKNDLKNKIYSKQRDALIKELSVRFYLSIRGIAEITGVNRENVRKVLQSVSREPSP